jgi:S1-C subfamily serine protease
LFDHKAVATVLAQICCVDNQLPQGAPTSPIVANMVCARLDAHLSRLAGVYRCNYTRYADDLTFSTHQSFFPKELADRKMLDGKLLWASGIKLSRTIRKNGFHVNPSKVRLQKYSQRQEVTGVITNEKVNVAREFIREIRAILHNIKTKGLQECQREYETKYASRRQRYPKATIPPLKLVVRGKIEYVGMVRGKDDDIYYKFMKELDSLIADFVKVPIRKDELEKLSEHVWLVEAEDNQGTGFMLAGTGLITASHVLGAPGTEITVTSADGAVKQKANILIRDEVRDLAILDIGISNIYGLETSPLVPTPPLPIILLGFPNHNRGDSIHVREGHVSSFRQDPSSPERLIVLNATVIYGNSGGPVLDKNYRVIGVALRGAQNQAEAQRTEFHAAMPIAVVQSLLILDIGISNIYGLETSPLVPTPPLPIILLGFPNHNRGDSIHVREGHVSSFRQDPSSPERLIVLNATVIYGNSGGPVLDKNYRVIGVALRGAQNQAEAQRTEFHAAMPIAVVQSLLVSRVAPESWN